jgi:hypothetical protein
MHAHLLSTVKKQFRCLNTKEQETFRKALASWLFLKQQSVIRVWKENEEEKKKKTKNNQQIIGFISNVELASQVAQNLKKCTRNRVQLFWPFWQKMEPPA